MHLIVDGYNVMHALPVGLDWPGASFRERREGFLDRLSAYAAERSHRVTVVFDGAKGGDAEGGAETWGTMRVIYTARGIEADHTIREMVEASAAPADVLLVSSDKSLSGYARSLGASVARADELVGKVWPRSTLARGRFESPGRRSQGARGGSSGKRRRAGHRHGLW